MRENGRSIGIGITATTLLLLIAPSAVLSEELPNPIELGSHYGTVNAVVFSPDGKMLLTGDGKYGEGVGLVRFWDVGAWTVRQE